MRNAILRELMTEYETDAHVRATQIHSYSHRSTAISVILPSAKRA